ncbi:type II toxin-antitoxin system RelE/ParE family toxin [Desulfoplanes sp.]
MITLAFSPLARKDLEAIGDYIAEDDPYQAVQFIKKLREQCSKITSAPKAYRLREELMDGLRSCPFQKYVIFFIQDDSKVLIVRVLHGAMDIETTFAK